MSIVPVFVGLDYHDEGIEVNVMAAQGEVLATRHCPNDWKAVVAVVPAHCRVVGAAIEACCGAADFAEELIQKAGWSVDLAHPGFVARMKQNPDKHDFGDARMLADLEQVGYLPRVWLAPQELRQLRRLVRYRQQLAGERRNLKLRIQASLREDRVPRPEARPWTQAWLHWLTKEADAGLIKAGNPQLRVVLIETAHRLMRFDARWVVLGASLRHRTRSGSIAAAAVANRWVRWLFHQMQTFQEAA